MEAVTPWACSSEQVEWPEPSPDAARQMSRRERLRSRGPYSASVPPEIASLDVTVSREVATEAAEAANALTRFDASLASALGGDEVSPLAAVLLRTESASSSQIEQITAGAKALALASIGESDRPNAALVAANTAAMEKAVALSDRISAASIIDVQAALLHDSDPTHTGAFRTEPVWIGSRGSSPHSASFVAPRFERVPGLIEDLVAFAHRADVEPFLQVALAHAQFETIHPFADGNGRTGRALVQAMLRAAGITQRITVPVSAGLLSEVEGYYEALTAYRSGDLDPIVTVFSHAAFAAIGNGEALVRELAAIREDWAGRVKARSGAAVWRALPMVMSQPAVTVNHLADSLGVSKPTAQTAIDQMVAAEVLVPANNFRRNRVWVAGEVVEALDDFAERAGRRRFAAG